MNITPSWRLVGLLLLSLGTVLNSNGIIADEVIKETPQGGINWSQGIIYAHGYGTAASNKTAAQRRLLSHRAAVVDAQRNLLEITKGVRITSEIKTDQLFNKSRETSARIEGVIRGAKVLKRHYQNNIASVTLAMPIAGDFLKITMPPMMDLSQTYKIENNVDLVAKLWLTQGFYRLGAGILDSLIPLARAADPIIIQDQAEADAYKKLIKWMANNESTVLGQSLDQSLGQAIFSFESNSVFSGLLIDASGVLDFELATIPKIRDIEGNVIYPSKQTSYSDIVNKRGVTYDFDINDAVNNGRVATRPFVIKAISTYKNFASDLTISVADALRVKQSPSTLKAMNQAGVLIVVAI